MATRQHHDSPGISFSGFSSGSFPIIYLANACVRVCVCVRVCMCVCVYFVKDCDWLSVVECWMFWIWTAVAKELEAEIHRPAEAVQNHRGSPRIGPRSWLYRPYQTDRFRPLWLLLFDYFSLISSFFNFLSPARSLSHHHWNDHLWDYCISWAWCGSEALSSSFRFFWLLLPIGDEKAKMNRISFPIDLNRIDRIDWCVELLGADLEMDAGDIEDLIDELEDLSDSGPEMDTMSVTSTPKPSLRPFFASSRSLAPATVDSSVASSVAVARNFFLQLFHWRFGRYWLSHWLIQWLIHWLINSLINGYCHCFMDCFNARSLNLFVNWSVNQSMEQLVFCAIFFFFLPFWECILSGFSQDSLRILWLCFVLWFVFNPQKSWSKP